MFSCASVFYPGIRFTPIMNESAFLPSYFKILSAAIALKYQADLIWKLTVGCRKIVEDLDKINLFKVQNI